VTRDLETSSNEIDRRSGGLQKKCACADTPGTECPHCKAERQALRLGRAGEISSIPAGADDDTADIATQRRIMRQTDGGDGGTGGGAVPAATSCDAPFSMTKVTSGSFQSGLSMDTYYPDLVGSGFWQHGSSGGPFDTGTRAGSNVQLIGTFPSPCRPDQFTLAQTVTYDKKVIDGVHDPKEGVAQDDIAKSGRNASTAPFRQDFLGGGYNVSMADPPSTNYGSASNIELDRSFTTSLVGPGGRASVNWSTSIRVTNGTVTRNTIS
jgi:hypothetical protein